MNARAFSNTRSQTSTSTPCLREIVCRHALWVGEEALPAAIALGSEFAHLVVDALDVCLVLLAVGQNHPVAVPVDAHLALGARPVWA